MPLVVEQLQLWAVGFKWANLDPNRPWLRIPTPVKDNFSTLLEAILNQHLGCMSLQTEKYLDGDPIIALHHIHPWIDDVYAAIHGRYFSRKLLKHAVIDRGSFQDWCERRNIPLPEFWFPPGWTEYRWPEQDFEPIPEGQDDAEASALPCAEEANPAELLPPTAEPAPENDASVEPRLKPAPLAKIVCKQIARVIWKDQPDLTIAAMAKHDLVLKYGGGQHYTEEVVRRWVKEVAPAAVSAKRGRPKKKIPTENE